MSEVLDIAGKRVWVAGHRGLVGAAIVRRLEQENCDILTTGSNRVDFRCQSETEAWIKKYRPQLVFVAAAKVGGILANATYPASFLYDNLAIETNIIHGSYLAGVEKLVFLGSSCIYPKYSEQPIPESALLTGALEPTNEWYAIAKIVGIKLCQAYRIQYGADYIAAMPTNLYGPGDNFDLTSSHVLPALIRKAHEAKVSGAPEMVVWGSGSPLREFLHVDDCADALVFLSKHYSDLTHINVGSGEEIAISEVAQLVADIVGFRGKLSYDRTKPDGTPRKVMSAEKIRGMGWKPKMALPDGIRNAYQAFVEANH